jgi:HAD superfamily hydrolase (TIGR01509 family)
LLERFQLRNIFTDPRLVISSHEVRCAKPDPAVYEVLLSRCRQALPDVRADQVLFIDDKLENVEAARAMGIRAIQYNSRTTPAEQLARALAAELRCDPQELLP